MHIGVIADDFTGASDIANTLAKGWADGGGLRTTQFLGIPASPAPADCEAGVVSLKSRSIPAAEAVSQSLAALNGCKRRGVGRSSSSIAPPSTPRHRAISVRSAKRLRRRWA